MSSCPAVWAARGIALVLVLLACAPAAHASSSSLTLQDRVLRLDVRGTSGDVAVRLRTQDCGEAMRCLQVADRDTPAAPAPAGCAPLHDDHLSASCDDAAVQRTEVVTDGAGAATVILTPGPRHPHFGCAAGTVSVLQGGGTGATAADDGCPQAIDCEAAYDGRVEADASDTVSDRCRWLVRDGVQVRDVPRAQPLPQEQRAPVGATGEVTGPASALRDVRVRELPRRRVAVRVRTRRSTDLTVALQRLVGGRWVRVRKVSVRRARRGTTERTVASGGRAGTFRVVVTNAAADRPLVSAALRLR